MKFLFVLLLTFQGKSFAQPGSETSPFRFHLTSEPTTLAVYKQKVSSAGYFLSQINGTLLVYQEQKLQGRLAKKCFYPKNTQVVCELRSDLKWSDGSSITAQDFVRSFQAFIDPKNISYQADLLFPVKNAGKVFKGDLPVSALGVSAKGDKLIFDLEQADSEFIYALTSPLLAPQKDSEFPPVEKAAEFKSSGPYKILSWKKGQRILLENNPYYYEQKSRPRLEVLFVSEDSVALNLYEKNELGFLRRLPTLYIEKFRSRPDFFEIDQNRFDYIGFSPALRDFPELRKALSLSLQYSELQKLFSAKDLPGCPGLPKHLFTQRPCLSYDPGAAKTALESNKKTLPKLELSFSKLGGEDHKRATEWIQAEWRKNLGLNVSLLQLENKIFVHRLETQPTTLFRKGVGPDRPTCLGGLEVLAQDSPENYLKITDPKFQDLLKKLKASLKDQDKKKLCTEAMSYLLENHLLIPTGPIHFTILVKPEWKGWKLNELNQLDLSGLHHSP